MNRFIKFLAVLLVCFGASLQAWAGVANFGNFSSPLPETQTLTPGQIFPVTLTANTNTDGIAFSMPFAFNPNGGNQFNVVPGGTCAENIFLANGQTCTVLVQFVGSTPGAFTGTLLGKCSFNAVAGGYSINCGSRVQGVLGQFAGNGLAAVVDTLGASGLSLLMLTVLGMGAFVSLRRPAGSLKI